MSLAGDDRGLGRKVDPPMDINENRELKESTCQKETDPIRPRKLELEKRLHLSKKSGGVDAKLRLIPRSDELE